MKFDRSLFVKMAETQVFEDGTLFVYVDEETLESTGRVLIKSKTSSGGALFYADGTPQQWIPVTERLPKAEEETYWVCTDAGTQCECRWTNINHFWPHLKTSWHWHIGGYPKYTKVIAWMPLPEPFKGGGDE